MQNGNWVPLDKSLAMHLPKSKPYSEIEAVFSLQVDYDEGNPATVAGYAALWSWSRKRVSNFLKSLGIELVYPEDTRKKQNQRGQIALQIRSRSGTDTEQIRLIDSKWLHDIGDRSGTDTEQIRSRSRCTTIDPNPNPDPNNTPIPPKGDSHRYSQSFENFWQACPKKSGKDAALRAWKKVGKRNDVTPALLIAAMSNQVDKNHFRGNDGQDYFPNPATWLNQGRWQDEIANQTATTPPTERFIRPTTYAQARDYETRQQVELLRRLENEDSQQGNDRQRAGPAQLGFERPKGD
ncbi:conserved hypothetical protein [Desulfosarcina cetonica]|uniref:hypothetical protein n=1 Tax=Desulfosarcina cetonica TaxID=90730 RepID=UPI0006D0D44E|nr:hypothetical protein [Desulfosarcina cetonica]VTR66764.1 conserved hypothetical protein [Desulfosarcina cetonica]